MRYKNFFIPTLKDAPNDAEIISHTLMIRAGMIKQSSTGIYSWLPLGLRVLKKIEQIVREEQDKAGANELLMPTIQSEIYGLNQVDIMITEKKCSELLIEEAGKCYMDLQMKSL